MNIHVPTPILRNEEKNVASIVSDTPLHASPSKVSVSSLPNSRIRDNLTVLRDCMKLSVRASDCRTLKVTCVHIKRAWDPPPPAKKQ